MTVTTDYVMAESSAQQLPPAAPGHKPNSPQLENAPQLSSRGLTILLGLMCLVPVATIAALFTYLPPVFEGELQASITAEGLPPGSYYQTHYSQREPVESGVLIVHNDSDQDWTHLNIQINKHYQIYEHRLLPAGESRRFRTDRFVSRTGAKFDLRYNPLSHVRVYARRPSKDRATFATSYDWQSVKSP